MISYEIFKKLIEPAERSFGRIDEKTREIYWGAIKETGETQLRLAVGQVVATHGFYKFPTVAEILDAVGDNRGVVEVQPDGLFCEECNGVGRTVVEYWVGGGTYYKEKFCVCPEGHRQRDARRRWFERRLLTVEENRPNVRAEHHNG